MPRQTSDPVRSLPTPPSQHFNAWLADGRGSVKRQSLKPEDALLAFHDARYVSASRESMSRFADTTGRTSPNRPQHRPEQHQNLYQQTRHESLSGIGQQRTPRRSQHTQSAPALPKPRPLTVYVGNTLGSIDEDPSSESSLPLPPPLQDAALKIKEAVQRVYRPIDWRKIPSPVFECVLDQLRLLHTSKQGNGCTTCYMRDLCAMQMTCKPWFSAAQHRLYSCVSIEGEDAPEKLKRFKVKHGARLVLLRRTLRAKALLAALVRDLRVPDPIIPLYQATGDPNPEYDDYLCLLASVVMACPNLELFAGFYPFYNHTFDRLTHALSTRRKLKQHVWVIAENADCTARAQKQLPPGIMDHDQSYQFLQYHDRWTQLETLLLCSPGSLGVLEHEVFVHALRSLPKLKHLCISSFDADDFHDGTLQTLPHIMSLRLEECPGVSDAGLTRWAASPNAVLIERLSLIHQNLTSLVTIARLLSSLDRLTKLTIIQSDTTPSLPLDTVVFQPFFASKTLQFLHWDIATSSTHSTDHSSPTPTLSLQDALATTDPLDATLPQTPNAHLALSLLHHGFPSLTRLRAPRDTDPRGALQAVCRPARDMNVLLEHDTGAMRFGRCWSGRNGGAPNQQLDEGGNHLQTARIRAQRRIERAAIQGPDVEKSGLGWKVVVEDYSACSTPGSGVGSTEQVSPAVVEKGGLEASNDCGNGSAVSGMGSYSRSDGDQSSSGSSSSSTTIRSSTEATPNSSSSSSSRSDPSVAYGVSEETELRDRYVVGHDWDKEAHASRPALTKGTSRRPPSPASDSPSHRNRTRNRIPFRSAGLALRRCYSTPTPSPTYPYP
ncbi:uncharacterized protein HMPREF1541_03006 [Cyphellophora europaea CBS 101466]|uniref:F-box domain-containing protein n=1 Tax=Cyphellophora europaea (strain CBS 101466) TaxID=1220924 RepID=W2RX35_CYPE1|nr:uncharacterized protein HMPREF1541_03006 [Cyphellophora europaea CBS 101466]ETN41071.1 hypothetical protein HMPREF1541_03006 [Cyphellophora europaea CBS 101466]